MDQRELVRQLEEHFRNESQAFIDQRKRIHQEREALSDEAWWDQLVERTRAIRPQMLEIFERNKEEMISKRFETILKETDYQEKIIQKQVMGLLPHVSAVRADMEAYGDLTAEQIQRAEIRAANPPSSRN